MFTKEYSDAVHEKLETIVYQPGLQDSGDLEVGMKTINATAEASGTANADYAAVLTLPKPADDRLAVQRVCVRLQTTIDDIPSGDTNLYCRVYVDVQDANHRLFDLDWTSSGTKLFAVDTHSGALATIFNILKDGTAHTFYFFFWKTGTGTGITISTVRLWEGVGSCVVGAGTPCLAIMHDGLLSGFMACSKVGTGSSTIRLCQGMQDSTYLWYIISAISESAIPMTISNNFGLAINTTIDADLVYLMRILFTLRYEN